jgi:Type II secretion system (T2SS), protein F
MTGSWVVSLTLIASGLVILPAPAKLSCVTNPKSTGFHLLPSSWRRALMCGTAVLAVGVLVNLWPWWVSLVLAGGSGALAFGMPTGTSQAERADDRRRLVIHADLLAACLDAGMSVGAALLAVPSEGPSRAPGIRRDDDPLKLLMGVAALLTLGADPETAWRSARNHPDLASLSSAARRSAAGGAVFADAVREHADNLRMAITDAAERSAGRAGVAMTAPLGLCFLPAFLCLGLAPVVVGLVSTLDVF